MSISDVLNDALPIRRRGRPPKARLTPVQEVVAAPLPKGFMLAVEKVTAAVKAFESASNALTEAQSTETKVNADAKVREAERRFQTASVQAEIAERSGENEGPSEEDLKALEAEVEAAKAARDGFEPRIAAYRDELERRRELLSQAINEFAAVEEPFRRRLVEAVDRQVIEAADLFGEAKAAMWIKNGYEALPSHAAPRFAKASGGEHTGTTSLDVPDELMRAYRTLKHAERRLLSRSS